MVQSTPHKWYIATSAGFIIQYDITAHSVHEATEYIKNYITSFQNWDYEIITLKAKVIKK